MRKLLTVILGLGVFGCYLPCAAQQTKAGVAPPPKMLQLVIEEVKPGKGGPHQKTEAAYVAAFSKMKNPAHYIALTELSGGNDAWFLADTKDWAYFEKGVDEMTSGPLAADLQKVSVADGDLLNETRTYYLEYMPELSYRPDINIGETRYVLADIVRVKPGHGKDFADLRKQINAAHEKVNMDEHMIVYYAGIGARTGMYIIFEPLTKLSSLDEIQKLHADGSDYRKALGDDFQQKARDFQTNAQVSSETQLFNVDPHMSFVSNEVADVAPSFWRPKTEMAKKSVATPAGKKEGEKK
jgi:hypothetical protein